MTDFDTRVQFYISCAQSAANFTGERPRDFMRRAMVFAPIARTDAERMDRVAMRAARFTVSRKGKERRALVDEARAEFEARARSAS